jgi:Glycosyl transferase family 11.
MKIVTFWGGLGNQIFEYIYYKWLQEQYPNENIFAYYPAKGLKDHNGLEINKRFDVKLPPTSKFTNLIGDVCFFGMRVVNRLHFPLLLTCNQCNEKYNRIFHCDYWQDKKYISKILLKFRASSLSKQNEDVLNIVRQPNVVAVHVRRGDYLQPSVQTIYGGICTELYYANAMTEIESRIKNPRYIFFSDDPQYVQEHFAKVDSIIVDWNKGEDSFLDMFLMSQSSNLIVANSTFSYWGARLNTRAYIVCCPNRWTNINPPDIILENWIKIES